MRNLSWGVPLACLLILVVLFTTQQAFLNQDQVNLTRNGENEDNEHLGNRDKVGDSLHPCLL